MRSLVLAMIVAGCAKAPPPQRVPVLPDAIVARLGTVGLAVAVDFHAVDVQALFGGQPATVPCAHDLIVAVRDAVATVGDGGWQGIVDGLPEAPARACLAQLGLVMRAGSGDGLEVDVHGTTLVAHWHGDVVTIALAGVAERTGVAPAALVDVIAKVPRDATAWLATTGLPEYKISQAVGWLEVAAGTWTLTVTAEGTTPTAAKEWIDGLVRGFSVALASRGTTVEGAWFAVTQGPMSAKLVATVPLAALAGSGS